MHKTGFIFRWFWATLLSFVTGLLLVYVIGGWVAERTAGQSYEYLQYYYDYYNYAPAGVSHFPSNQDIVIVDAHDNSIGSRSGMAQVLDRLSSLHPAMVGLDILYPSTHESTMEDDEALQASVGRMGERLIVASRHHGPDSLEHSFFTYPAGALHATVNAQSFYGFTPRDSVGGQWVDKMVFAIARKYAEQQGKPFSVPASAVVNYESLSFRKLTAPEQISASVVDGKIVLIGDCKDAKDEVDLPFKIEGKSSLPGVMVNAYQLASLISPDRAFKPVSRPVSLLLCFLLTLLFGCFSSWWSARENAMVDAKEITGKKQLWGNVFAFLVKPLLVLLVEMGALLLLFVFIHHLHLIPDLLPFMAAVLFMDTFDKVSTMVFKFNNKKKSL